MTDKPDPIEKEPGRYPVPRKADENEALAPAPGYRFAVGDGRLKVFLEANAIGEDWVVRIGGGEKPHIGAVAIALPRPSLQNPYRSSSSTSVFTVPGHKEDELTKRAAAQLAAQLNKIVVVTAGLHSDNATPEEIAELEKGADAVVSLFLQSIEKLRPQPPR